MADNNLLKVNLLSFFTGAIGFTYFFFPLFLQSLGFNGVQIGILMAVLSFTALVVFFPIGIINDVLSIRWTLALALIAYFVFFFFFSHSSTFLFLVMLFFIAGIARDSINRSLENATYKLAERDARSFGKFQLFGRTGAAIGAVIAGASFTFFAFEGTFKIFSVVLLLLVFLALSIKTPKASSVKISDYGSDFFRRKTVLFAFALFMFSLHWGAESTSYALFLRHSLKLDLFWTGIFIGPQILFLGLGGYFIGQRIKADKFKRFFVLGMVLSGIGGILTVNANVFLAFFFRAIHEIGDGFVGITQMFWISLLFDKKRIGGSSGIVLTIMVLGSVAGALIFGPLGEMKGYGFPLIASGFIVLVESVVLGLYLYSKKSSREFSVK